MEFHYLSWMQALETTADTVGDLMRLTEVVDLPQAFTNDRILR
jgi:hypothetical protein